MFNLKCKQDEQLECAQEEQHYPSRSEHKRVSSIQAGVCIRGTALFKLECAPVMQQNLSCGGKKNSSSIQAGLSTRRAAVFKGGKTSYVVLTDVRV